MERRKKKLKKIMKGNNKIKFKGKEKRGGWWGQRDARTWVMFQTWGRMAEKGSRARRVRSKEKM